MNINQIRIGVISDTHGLIRPAALAALQGVDHIIHAGDIGTPAVLEELQRLAPLTVVRGNIDTENWAQVIPETAVAKLGQVRLYVLHDLNALKLDPCAADFAAVISGHSHIARQEFRRGVLYFNPGSAGPRRFHLPVTLGFLTVTGRVVSGRILKLADRA